MGKSMVSSVNSNTNATRIGWHLWEIALRFAPGLPPGWVGSVSDLLPPPVVLRAPPTFTGIVNTSQLGSSRKGKSLSPRCREPDAKLLSSVSLVLGGCLTFFRRLSSSEELLEEDEPDDELLIQRKETLFRECGIR